MSVRVKQVENQWESKFLKDGWLILDLVPASSEKSTVEGVRDALLARLHELWLPSLPRIEDYHRFVEDDALHIKIQSDLTEIYQECGYGPSIVEENLEFFRQLIGPDLHVQKFPYLRIARPGKPQDNIGIHRDTHYGCTPFELSVSVPFTETGPEGALGVLSGSHLLSEAALPATQVQSKDVEKGSVKHKLGFLYAPKQMSSEVRNQVTPVPLRVGQALVFSLSLIHGQETNRSNVTRFQSDIRVVNSLAPIQWERNVHKDYYRRLSSSAVSIQARRYLAANGARMPAEDL